MTESPCAALHWDPFSFCHSGLQLRVIASHSHQVLPGLSVPLCHHPWLHCPGSCCYLPGWGCGHNPLMDLSPCPSFLCRNPLSQQLDLSSNETLKYLTHCKLCKVSPARPRLQFTAPGWNLNYAHSVSISFLLFRMSTLPHCSIFEH